MKKKLKKNITALIHFFFVRALRFISGIHTKTIVANIIILLRLLACIHTYRNFYKSHMPSQNPFFSNFFKTGVTKKMNCLPFWRTWFWPGIFGMYMLLNFDLCRVLWVYCLSFLWGWRCHLSFSPFLLPPEYILTIWKVFIYSMLKIHKYWSAIWKSFCCEINQGKIITTSDVLAFMSEDMTKI